jgi:ATP-binding cassette subfamily B protein
MRHLLRLRTLLQPYRWQVLLSLLLLLSITGLGLVIPIIIRQVIDVGLLQGEIGFMIQAALLILGIGLLKAALTYFQRYATEWVAQRVGYDLRNRLYDHIQHLSFTYHDHSQTGQLISRCIEDVRAIERFAGSGLIDLTRITLL